MVQAKYLDPADAQWKPLEWPPHTHPSSTRIPGEIVAYAGAAAPSGWLICDGSAFDAATYPDLALVIPSLTLPDLRGRFPVGVAGAVGALLAKGGSSSHDHTAQPLPAHAHTAQALAAHDHPGVALAAHTHGVAQATTSSDSHNHSVNVASATTSAAGSHSHATTDTPNTASAAVAGGQTLALGGHDHGTSSNGSHTHTVNPAAVTSASDAHSHTVTPVVSGASAGTPDVSAVSAGTPVVDAASAGTPDVDPATVYPPYQVVNFIIYTGA